MSKFYLGKVISKISEECGTAHITILNSLSGYYKVKVLTEDTSVGVRTHSICEDQEDNNFMDNFNQMKFFCWPNNFSSDSPVPL